MGSSTNGITRGQLRPHFGGRSPPFIICGLFIALIIVSYCYWNLSFRFNILQKNAMNAEENLRIGSSRNEMLFKENQKLTDKLQSDVDIIKQNKNLLTKKDEEINQLSNQLRHKGEEINRLNSQIETLKTDADKCKETSDNLQNELNTAKAKIKELETTNTSLKEKITSEQNTNTANKPKQENKRNVEREEVINKIQNKDISKEGNQNEKTPTKIEDPDVSEPHVT